jgi:hypothetical protein
MDDTDREYEEVLASLENYEGAPLGRQFPPPLKLAVLVVLALIATATGAALIFYWIAGQP